MAEIRKENRIIKSLWVGARFVVAHVIAGFMILFIVFLASEYESILEGSHYAKLLESFIVLPMLVFFTTALPTFITGLLISLIFDNNSKHLLSIKSSAISVLVILLWLYQIDFEVNNYKMFILVLMWVAVSVFSSYLFIKKEETILFSRK